LTSVTESDAPLEVEPLTLTYSMDQGELLRCVPALNRGTTFSVIGGGLLAGLALLNLLLADPLMALIAGAGAVALLSGWYCIPVSWLGLRLTGERARMPITMTVDDPRPWTSPGRRSGVSSAAAAISSSTAPTREPSWSPNVLSGRASPTAS
jgi:hypothetical protein